MIRTNLGILLAVSSLPGNHGIGDFGDSCYRFIDWLSKHHYRYWQVLPLNPLGPGDSPYMSTCSNALDYRYISLDYLVKLGLLDEVPSYRAKCTSVNYWRVGLFKKKYLMKAYRKFMEGNTEGFRKFKTRNPWVMKFGTFEVFKEMNYGKQWNEWEDWQVHYYEHHNNPPKSLLDRVNFSIFCQYMAYKQWKHVLAYARLKGVNIICDMPFYVGFDGVECWLNKDQFQIDGNCHLFEVGGVGPDAFSDEGQLWGSPIYNFAKMRENNYQLLVDRVGYLSNLCDYLRIDHFRAFDTYYVIPAGMPDARIGEWKIGPREEFFDELYRQYPDIKLIAEDLGDLRPEVLELRDHYNLPGMFISEFTIFDLNNESTDRQIVYPGTHDNETLRGWYKNLNDDQKNFIANRLQVPYNAKLYEEIVKYIYSLKSWITIFALQDVLRLDNKARMNVPGTVGAPNWMWKLKDWSWEKKVKYPKRSWINK